MPADVWINKGSGTIAAGKMAVGSVLKVRATVFVATGSGSVLMAGIFLTGSSSGSVPVSAPSSEAPFSNTYIYIEYELTPISNTELVVSGHISSKGAAIGMVPIPLASEPSTIAGFDFAGEDWTPELFLSWGSDDGSAMAPTQLTVTLNDVII